MELTEADAKGFFITEHALPTYAFTTGRILSYGAYFRLLEVRQFNSCY